MAKQLVKELENGDAVSAHFQVNNSQLYEFRNKPGRYAILQLSDKSGSVRGVCWDNGEEIHQNTPVDSVVHVEGRVESFNAQLQVIIRSVSPARDDEYDSSDFLPTTTLDVDDMFDFMTGEIEKIENPFLKNLLKSFFGDEEFVQKFKSVPAAKTIHHNYIGGLLEHTSNCLRLGLTLCEIYPRLRRDLLLASIMLHDAGKTIELSFETTINYTDKGRLLGHIVLGERMIYDKIKTIEGFPESLANELLHLIVSHHGENNTGSPKRPKTPEACALHYLENLDAQTKRFFQLIDSSPAQHARWTHYDRLLDRYLFKGYDDIGDDAPEQD
ncbi:MAG: HD domain-containing protein [bacterium]